MNSNDLEKEWKNFKEELKTNIDKTIEKGTTNIEVLKLMTKILENSKLKIIEKDDQEGGV